MGGFHYQCSLKNIVFAWELDDRQKVKKIRQMSTQATTLLLMIRKSPLFRQQKQSLSERMGLSISQSNTERQRAEESSQKKAQSVLNSEAKSMERNEMSDMRDEIKAAMATTPLKSYNNSGKKDIDTEEEKKNTVVPNRKSMEPQRMEEEEPKIKIAAPAEKRMVEYYDKSKYERNISQFETVQHPFPANNNLLRPDAISKSIKLQTVYPEPKQPAFFSGEKEEVYQRLRASSKEDKDMVANSNELKRYQEINERVLLNSASKTLTAKSSSLTQNKGNFKEKEQPNGQNFDVEFQNFDWEIPKATQPLSGSNKKLKPQASVVLISKLGKQDQENKKHENKSKKVWKNRRQLMNEIVNDRLETIDNSFSLNFCMPNEA